ARATSRSTTAPGWRRPSCDWPRRLRRTPRPSSAPSSRGRIPDAKERHGSTRVSVLALAAAAALRLLDPTGDAAGDGTLMPPTSPVYANAAVFDLQEVTLTPGAAEGEPAVLGVAMGAIERTDLMPAGFNRVVVDVYIDVVEGGAEATLAGPDLLMPPGRGWDYVVRLTPRGASGAAAPLDADFAVQWQPLPLAIDADV